MNKFARRHVKICLALLLLVCMLLPSLSVAEEEKGFAQDVTQLCSFSYHGKLRDAGTHKLYDGNWKSHLYLPESYVLEIYLHDSDAKSLCIGWMLPPEQRTVIQYDKDGQLIAQLDEDCYAADEIIELLPETVRVDVGNLGVKNSYISELRLFTEGALPEPWVKWEPTPEKLDFLVISTHFDDDILFLGACMPLYGGEKGYTGSLLYMTYPSRLRYSEGLMGAWTQGQTTYPLFALLPDLSSFAEQHKYAYSVVLNVLVRYYRQYKPLVVFTQDVAGEYGHWQHVRTTACALEAVQKAADPNYDPLSFKEYGTWQVQKVYTHLYPGTKLPLDTRKPLEHFGGKSILEVAQEAFLKHESQVQKKTYYVSDENEFSIADMGLSYSYVDDPGLDAFDGIDPWLLCNYDPVRPPLFFYMREEAR